MRFLPEPPIDHAQPPRAAVLLINLGTPAAPTVAAVRSYLKQFLSDPRVVEIPAPIWWPILHGVILNTRPRRSAAKYASIWTAAGSPLKVNSEQQALQLRGWLGDRGMDVDVALAMRYGEPSIASVLDQLRARRVDRLLVVPMYPQYSATTTATAFDAVNAALARTRNVPEVRWVRHFCDQREYIEALKVRVLDHWRKFGRADDEGGKLVMSFHGVPRRTLDRGDPYHCQCQKTGRLLAEALRLESGQYAITFQSRFGRAEWLRPYTASVLQELGARSARRVDVVCPGFVADCLETLEEIAMEGNDVFRRAGGGTFHYIPALNDSPAFIEALVHLVQTHTHGWLIDRTDADLHKRLAQETASRAQKLGAAG
ncbi:MAG TPA: ferrochelatase [Burkholderiaceae bacterium]|nr:ferrochelatase [Burkholderiaceae bacterium]